MSTRIIENVKKGEAFLVDVRTDAEWRAGHAEGAFHFELSRIQRGELPIIPQNKPVYLYCRSGNRSGTAKRFLLKAGFNNVENLGGLDDWQALGGKIGIN